MLQGLALRYGPQWVHEDVVFSLFVVANVGENWAIIIKKIIKCVIFIYRGTIMLKNIKLSIKKSENNWHNLIDINKVIKLVNTFFKYILF